MGKEVAEMLEQFSSLKWQRPLIFAASKPETKNEIAKLQKSGQITVVLDQIEIAIHELFDIEFPGKKDTKTKQEVEAYQRDLTDNDPDSYGSWVFFPWSGYLVHFPTVEHLRLLRTARNRNLVTEEEQNKLYQSSILVAGMSVGSNVVEALLSQGIGGKLILADMDILEPTNLNRIRAKYQDIGTHKVDYVAKLISETDPYLEQVHLKDGLNEENFEIVLKEHTPDIIIDEMDTLRMKLIVRMQSKDKGIPVLMAADNGDGILLDIERFDLDKELPILHGRIPDDVVDSILDQKGKLDRKQTGALIGRYFIGFENTTIRMIDSLGEVGKTLPSWPQLGGAATLAGITIAYCAKKILVNQPLNTGRFSIGPDDQLNPEIATDEYREHLNRLVGFLKNQFS